MKRLVALPILTLDIVQEQDRDILFLPSLWRLLLLLDHFRLGNAVCLTHSAAPPRDRDVPHAMTDRVWRAKRVRAPSPRQPWSRQSPFELAGVKGNRVR